MNNNILLTDSNYDLALNVIKFLETLAELQEEILNYFLNIKDKKKFENEKRKLREQAKSIIKNNNKSKEEFHTICVKKLYEENSIKAKNIENKERTIEKLKSENCKLEDINNKLSNDLDYLSEYKFSTIEKGNTIEKKKKDMENMKNKYKEQIFQLNNSELKEEYQKLNCQYKFDYIIFL